MGLFDAVRRVLGGGARRPPDRPPPPSFDAATVAAAMARLEALARRPAIGRLGGPPPDDPCASWFGRAVALPGEGHPMADGRPLPPVLQIRVDELPSVPPELAGTALLVLFMDPDLPFDEPHGTGWVIREYASLDGLAPLPPLPAGAGVPRPKPVTWAEGPPEIPDLEDAESLLDVRPLYAGGPEVAAFTERLGAYGGVKVGGYPCIVQHGTGLAGFVFQVGETDEAGWSWNDLGVATFFRFDGTWRWDCQFT